jgi:hypothetical protein
VRAPFPSREERERIDIPAILEIAGSGVIAHADEGHMAAALQRTQDRGLLAAER